MHNCAPLTSLSPINPPLLISRNSSHVSIAMEAPDPSVVLVETAQGAVTKHEEQLRKSEIDNLDVISSMSGPAAAQAPIASTPPPNANQLPRSTRGTVSSIITHNSSTFLPPAQEAPRDLTQYSDFWNAYNELADKEDREIVKGYGSDLDTLLIFAGLFSATNTAFIIESYKDLKEDQAETTNKLLRSLLLTIHQPSSFTESFLHEAGFIATKRSTSTNVFFFTSLFCSLLAAFGAVIGKQWLNHYEKEGQLRSPAERGVERHKKYLGLEQWHFQGVIETLPTLLQISLLSFLIGLVQFLWTFNLPLAILAFLYTLLTSAFWFVFIMIGVSFPSSPFQTRLSIILQNRWPFTHLNMDASDEDVTEDEIIKGRCVDWLRKRSTASITLGIVAQAVAISSEAAKRGMNLDCIGAAIQYLVQSKFELTNGHYGVRLGVTSDTLQSSLVGLQDMVRNWDFKRDLVHPEDSGNRSFLRTLRHDLWGVLLSKQNGDPALKVVGLQILEKICTQPLESRAGGDFRAIHLSTWEDRCSAWFNPCKAELEKVWSISGSILQGPTGPENVPKRGCPLGVLLQSKLQDNLVSLHVSDQSLRVLLPILEDLLTGWDSKNDLVHQEDPSNHLFLQALSTKMSFMATNTNWEKDMSGGVILKLLEMLDYTGDEEGLQPMIGDFNGCLSMDSIDPISKLRWLRIIYRKLKSLELVPKNYIQCHGAVHQLLLSTMWESDQVPEYQYYDLRIGWILDDFDAIYPRAMEYSYIQYLENGRTRWPEDSSTNDILYVKSLRHLLVTDYEVWSAKLESSSAIRTLCSILSRTEHYTEYIQTMVGIFLLSKGNTEEYVNPSMYWRCFVDSPVREKGQSLFMSMIAVVDSPTEGVRVASGFWKFLVAVGPHWRTETRHMVVERNNIGGYLMGRLAVRLPRSLLNILDKSSESIVDLRLQNLPGQYTEDIHPVIDDIDRSRFILSVPGIHPDVELLAAEMFSLAISRLRIPDDLENFIRSMGKIFDGPSDTFIGILEKERHIEIIAEFIGDGKPADGTKEQLRRVRWWCLRLFLVMWHRRSSVDPTPYVSDVCFQSLDEFLSSMKNQVEGDVIESQRGIDEVSHTTLSGLQFMESICTYVEFGSAKRGLSIRNAAVLGYRETCAHFIVSGANREDQYQGDGGSENWKKHIAHLVDRVENLR